MKQSIKLKGKLRSYMCWPFYLAALLVCMDVIAFFHSKQVFFFMLFFTVVYVAVELGLYYSSQPILSAEILNFAIAYASVQKRLLSELEIPYALLDDAGKLIWANARFCEMTGISREYRKSITTLFPQITREVIRKTTDSQTLELVREEKNIRAYLKKIGFEDFSGDDAPAELPTEMEFLTAIYLFDDTELMQARTRMNDQKLVAALVYIDNYEEALDSIADVKKSMLVAVIDRKVNQYFAKVDGLVRKIEKDKYFVVFKYCYLEKMKADRFHLLEEVKSTKVGNEMAVTLSMGIGVNKHNYNENYEMARAAIDLALGRGGDQVVLKEADNTTYYGGKAKQVESKNRVKARVKAQALQEIIMSCENVFVMGHSLTDVDSLGAAIGVFCAARSVGKKVQIVVNSPTSSIRPLMETLNEDNGYPADLFINSAQALEMVSRKSLVMVVDTNRPSYTECPDLLRQTRNIVVFDHHRQGQELIENPILSYIEPYASSACEMVAEVLQYFNGGIHLNATESDCIYAGILIDTNNFMTKTGVRTFEAAAFLKRSGADVTRVRKVLRNDMSCYKARAAAVRDAEVYKGAYAISVCPSENVESPTIVGAQAANELLNIIGIKASFVLTEFNDKIYISSRSIDEINVQLIMEKLGGGGHLNTAGAQLKDCTLEEAKQILRQTIDSMDKEGNL